MGLSADLADVAFAFNSEVGMLTSERSVVGSGLFAGVFGQAPDDIFNTDIDTDKAQSFVNGLEKALAMIQASPEDAVAVAQKEFPNLPYIPYLRRYFDNQQVIHYLHSYLLR